MILNLSIEYSDEDISDILTTAFEGGINYWCRKAIAFEVPDENKELVHYASDSLKYGGKVMLFDAESSDSWLLTNDNIKAGLEKYFSETAFNSEISFDPANIDANDADNIIQYAIFGELVFA